MLVTIIGGTACPFLYHFVTLTQSGAKATNSFGTCNEAQLVERKGDSISLTMHDYRGPFEPEAERAAAFKRTVIFVFRDGVIFEKREAVPVGRKLYPCGGGSSTRPGEHTSTILFSSVRECHKRQ